ncbi:restriction endonuclease subunit S [Treponema saccharophilum]|uniref:Restriction modification system DNA specificity domain n=1 Tax=Treponema saccharophilum DSM 2985 TaxID=907348 RepID=H7EJK8_9SPIR|nr:restriction endonuclease subunit S [Treponema saccharophilum]EIC02246.1 restriction modification system DNA specificity domain [Treponema saccharophilum DSM 2985]BDC97286.1 hypothetical protein TRSA_23850 [Treponema saccharophilum]
MKTENGKLKKYKLGEICDLNLSSLKSSDRIDEILYLDTSNITENRIADLQSFSIANAPSRAQRKVRNNTIIFSTVRPNQNHFGIIKNPQSNLIVSSGFTTLDIKNPEDFDANYVYLKLTQPYVVNYLQTLAQNSVSAYPSINPDDIGNLSFYFPPLESQQKIAAVLSTLDDKIALNRRMNAKLEQMAKRLYDHWFVQFDFPFDFACFDSAQQSTRSQSVAERSRGYKSSGGKMEYNEVLKREIPAGWEVKKLSDFAKYVDNTDSADMIVNYISTDNMLPNKAGISDSISKPLKGNFVRYEKFDVLISNIRPYFKKIWFSNLVGNCSTDVLCIRSNSESDSFFIYRTLWQDDFFDYVMQGAKGSKMPRGDKTRIMDFSVAYPSDNTDVLKKFNSFFEPLQKSIWKNESETQKLTALRDRLLPLLMNGQVEVK